MVHFPDALCAALAFVFLVHAWRDLENGQRVGLEPYWRGLGRGGSWMLTRATTYLGLAFVLSFAAVLLHRQHAEPPKDQTVQQSSKP